MELIRYLLSQVTRLKKKPSTTIISIDPGVTTGVGRHRLENKQKETSV